MANKLLHKLLQKKWTDEDVSRMVGKFQGAYLSYATDDAIRLGGASGGAVTAMLDALLREGSIDGALVCTTHIINNKVRTRFIIARHKEGLLKSQGSKYVETSFIKEAIRLIDEFDGKVAVVGLPCNITALRKKITKNAVLASKVVFTIALFCGHNSQKILIDTLLDRLLYNKTASLEKFRFRIGHWRGRMVCKLIDDQVIERSFSEFSLYQNLFFFAERKCLSCFDHFGYSADLNIGDIWSYHFKRKNIKYNCIIAKTERGENLLQRTSASGALFLFPIKIFDVLDGQSRSVPAHYNVSARHRVAEFFGISIPDMTKCKVKWHEYLVAFIILINWKWSLHPFFSKLIFSVPKPILKIYLYFFKGLESLK